MIDSSIKRIAEEIDYPQGTEYTEEMFKKLWKKV